MRQNDDRILAMLDAYRMSARSPELKDIFRSWMSARMQALKRDDPSRSKKEYWRIAKKEWIELRRRQIREWRRQLKEYGWL